MMTLITAAAIAAGQPAASPAQMPMPAGHEMKMTKDQQAKMKKKCCCDEMGETAHDVDAAHPQHGA